MKCRTEIFAGYMVAMTAVICAGPARADAPIGAVSEPNTKDAIAVPEKGGTARDLHFQEAVYENDTVITRDLGTALQFTDQSLLTVSSNSKVVLDSFVFDKSTGSLGGTVKLAVGVFRLVTGGLVKHDSLQLVTPVTTLTIRGTDVVVSVETDGTTRLRLYEGRIRLRTCNGSTIWVQAGERIIVSPACVAVILSVNSGNVIATAGNADGSNGVGNGTSGGAPGPGGGPGPAGDPASSDGNDPGSGNGGPGLGNGGTDNGKGNSGDPGDGHGNNPAH